MTMSPVWEQQHKSVSKTHFQQITTTETDSFDVIYSVQTKEMSRAFVLLHHIDGLGGQDTGCISTVCLMFV